MLDDKRIKTALISVFHKEGLDRIIEHLKELQIDIYSTGGTQEYLEKKGAVVHTVEGLTSYPSILSGRVKTLHPKVFGGILARRDQEHLSQLETYEIPEIDLVIVDLYPFEDTVRATTDEEQIIEKIDIGGISLIRAAAKNYKDVVVIASKDEYEALEQLLSVKKGFSSISDRKALARKAFMVSSHYDTAIFQYFDPQGDEQVFKLSLHKAQSLRYGENPHQKGTFYGDLTDVFDILGGKPLSYNNLVDVDAAVGLMYEFKDDRPTFAILKHTNPCGVATRPTIAEAWVDALAGDNVSAFGGILISNSEVDLETAKGIDAIFYEVLIAPAFSEDALDLLQRKKKRILLRIKDFAVQRRQFKSLLHGLILQDTDHKMESKSDMQVVTRVTPSADQFEDLVFANKCVKHLKSNTIVLAKNKQLVGMGCGQTSRVDALKQAILKANHFGFDVTGAVMASDAFFPFPDCVEIANTAGVVAVIQPGGSIRDQDSIDFCDSKEMSMVTTGTRHFKH